MRVGKIVEWLLNLNFSIITTSAFNDSVFERSLETKTFLKKKVVLKLEKKGLINFHSNQDPFLHFFSLWGGYGVKRGCGEKAGIVFVKLFGFDSDLYLVVERRVLCIKWKKPVVRE